MGVKVEHEKDVIDEIRAERERQIKVEGWTTRHDDLHDEGELARAAAAYALQHTRFSIIRASLWPWPSFLWRPKSPRRDLIRAAALLVAEIERLDRAESQSHG